MKKLIYFMFILILISCSESKENMIPIDRSGLNEDVGTNNNPPDNSTTSGWLIPISEVKDGGPGKDGIPSIDMPIFLDANDPVTNYLNDDDLVVGVVNGGEAKAYPHLILDWHEVVNDIIGNAFATISYCPLTGTAFAWESMVNGVKSTFGVSGLLYNTNLILYDRSTDSNWSQMGLKCVNGDRIGDEPKLLDVIETNWGTWKSLYPNSQVLSQDTGFNRPYGEYPYGDYKTNHEFFIFSASPSNSALPNKERVYAIINGKKSKVYQFEKFTGGIAIKETFNGNEYVVVGNNEIIYAFELNESQSALNFQYEFDNSEVFFSDNEGNKWSVFGSAIEGPRTGEMLKGAKSVVSFWFAVAAFYPNPIIYQ